MDEFESGKQGLQTIYDDTLHINSLTSSQSLLFRHRLVLTSRPGLLLPQVHHLPTTARKPLTSRTVTVSCWAKPKNKVLKCLKMLCGEPKILFIRSNG